MACAAKLKLFAAGRSHVAKRGVKHGEGKVARCRDAAHECQGKFLNEVRHLICLAVPYAKAQDLRLVLERLQLLCQILNLVEKPQFGLRIFSEKSATRWLFCGRSLSSPSLALTSLRR